MNKIFYHKDLIYKNELLSKFPNAEQVDDIKDCPLVDCWYLEKHVRLKDTFDVDYTVPTWDRQYLYKFKNKNSTGLYFIPNTVDFDNIREVELDIFNSAGYDVFFLCCGELIADEMYAKLKRQVPTAKKIENVLGIYNAHKEAAKNSTTPYFYVVDADVEVFETFHFDHVIQPYEFDMIHIWHCKNSVNDLEYGNGGIKLLPTFLFEADEPTNIDITTSLSKTIRVVPELCGIHHINFTPFNAWRSAFREGVKLQIDVINSGSTESEHRLRVWTSKGVSKKYGSYAVLGAKEGKKYALENFNNSKALRIINDTGLLYEKFVTAFPNIKYLKL
jgi:hypothetical protein